MDIHQYRAELAAKEAMRKEQRAKFYQAQPVLASERRVQTGEEGVDVPVQSDLFGEDLHSTRYRAECQRTGKRGKHLGVRHES